MMNCELPGVCANNCTCLPRSTSSYYYPVLGVTHNKYYWGVLAKSGRIVRESADYQILAGFHPERKICSRREEEFVLSSLSRIWIAVGVLRTMELKPRHWYPSRNLTDFDLDWVKKLRRAATVNGKIGWQIFAEGGVNNSPLYNVTIGQLLLNTHGLAIDPGYLVPEYPRSLFFKPGTKFGFSFGDTWLAWLLRDYWKADLSFQKYHRGRTAAEPAKAGIIDVLRFLYMDNLKIRSGAVKYIEHKAHTFTGKIKAVAKFFDGTMFKVGIVANAQDTMKLAMFLLRKGRAPTGEAIISNANWEKWAMRNLLPQGKQAHQLIDWHTPKIYRDPALWYTSQWAKEGLADDKKASFGHSYLSAIWTRGTLSSKQRSEPVYGWCGYYGSCILVSYEEEAAFVMMQDRRKKYDQVYKRATFVMETVGFAALARDLQCQRNLSVTPQNFTLPPKEVANNTRGPKAPAGLEEQKELALSKEKENVRSELSLMSNETSAKMTSGNTTPSSGAAGGGSSSSLLETDHDQHLRTTTSKKDQTAANGCSTEKGEPIPAASEDVLCGAKIDERTFLANILRTPKENVAPKVDVFCLDDGKCINKCYLKGCS